MNKKQTAFYAVLVSVFLVAAVAIGFILPILRQGKTEISVDLAADPIGASADPSGTVNPALANRDLVSDITLDADNVQKLISTLSRPAHYYLEAAITLVSNDEQISYTGKQWKSESGVKTVISDNIFQNELHYLEQGDTVYSWKKGDVSYSSLPAGDFSSDDLIMIPTYEDMIELDKSLITECDMEKFGSIDCIAVTVEYPDLSYTEKYMVSVDLGLLVNAETFKNGVSVYRASVTFLNQDEPAEEVFRLPGSSGSGLSGR